MNGQPQDKHSPEHAQPVQPTHQPNPHQQVNNNPLANVRIDHLLELIFYITLFILCYKKMNGQPKDYNSIEHAHPVQPIQQPNPNNQHNNIQLASVRVEYNDDIYKK